MTTNKRWWEEHYRQVETDLNLFRNKKLSYSDFIERNKDLISRIEKEAYQRAVEVAQDLAQQMKVIMWHDEPAQHIRNIQNNDTLELFIRKLQALKGEEIK